jgi:hypothetical protein
VVQERGPAVGDQHAVLPVGAGPPAQGLHRRG